MCVYYQNYALVIGTQQKKEEFPNKLARISQCSFLIQIYKTIFLATLICASIRISTFWASILSPYSLVDLFVDFSAFARSDALSMTSETLTEYSETGNEEEGVAPAETEEEIEESSFDVVFAFCKIFH